jgi:hypothetical protein
MFLHLMRCRSVTERPCYSPVEFVAQRQLTRTLSRWGEVSPWGCHAKKYDTQAKHRVLDTLPRKSGCDALLPLKIADAVYV